MSSTGQAVQAVISQQMMFSASTLCVPSFWQRDVFVIPVQRAPADSHGKTPVHFYLRKKKYISLIWNVHLVCLLCVAACLNLHKWRGVISWTCKCICIFFFLGFVLLTWMSSFVLITRRMFLFGMIWRDFFFYPRSSFEPPPPHPPPPHTHTSTPKPIAQCQALLQTAWKRKEMCMCKTKYTVLMWKC